MSNSAISPMLPLYLAELVFGLVYALLIHWIAVNGWLRGNTAWSVVIGDGVTLLIQWLFIPQQWSPWVTLCCFAFSGTPMAISYFFRYQMGIEKTKHTKRPWPTAALRAREESLMELTRMIADLENAAARNQINAGFLLQLSNRMHIVKKTLTTV